MVGPVKKLLTLIAVLLGGVLIAAFLSFHDTVNVRRDSPLYAAISPGSNYDNKRIQTSVLQQLPLGSRRLEIEAFIAKNFTGVTYFVEDDATFDKAGKLKVKIQAVSYQSLSGREKVEIYLILDRDGRLEQVVVESDRAYL